MTYYIITKSSFEVRQNNLETDTLHGVSVFIQKDNELPKPSGHKFIAFRNMQNAESYIIGVTKVLGKENTIIEGEFNARF